MPFAGRRSAVALATAAAVVAAAAAPLSAPAASPQPTYVPLNLGVPTPGFVPRGGEVFYRAVVPLPLPRLAIVVTPLAGNPDLYVTVGPFWDPVPGNAQWASSGTYGPDAVLLPPNASFTAMGGWCKLGVDANCTLQVGVVGSRASNFSVAVTVGGDGSEALVPGLPALGSLPPGATDYYNFTVPGGTGAPGRVDFRVTPTGGGSSGAPLSLYVASSSAGRSRPTPADPTSYCASAAGSGAPGPSGAVALSLANTSACACPPATPGACVYYAAVVAGGAGTAGAAPTVYSLTADTSSTAFTLLTDGAPQSGGGLEGSSSTYLFNAVVDPSSGRASAQVTLSPSRGTARQYLLLGPAAVAPGAAPPGPGNYALASPGGSGTQVVSLSSSDPIWTTACPDATQPCPLVVAAMVTSATSAAWDIVASAAAYVTLQPSVPLEGAAVGGAVARYRFPATQPGATLVFSAAAVSGDPSLYVGCDGNNATVVPDPRVPGSYTWASVSAGDEVVVINTATDPGACAPPCSYYVGVASSDWAVNGSTGFFVLGRGNSSSTVPTPLVVGDLLLDAVPAGVCNTYATPWDVSIPSLSVAAYTSVGAVALFGSLSNASVLTPGNAQYVGGQADAGAGGGDGTAAWQGLTAAVGDAAFNATCGASPAAAAACTLYLLVCDNTTAPAGGGGAPAAASHYELSVSADAQRLVDSVPVQGTVQGPPDVRYYRYTAPTRAPFTVSLTPISGDPDLLVSYGAPPNASWAQWSAYSPAGDFVNVQWTEPWLAGATFPADFYVGVTGFDGAAAYSLLVDSNPYVQLENGAPQVAVSKPGQLTYFLLEVPPTDAAGFEVGFTFTLTPISGDGSPLIFANTVNHSKQYCAHCGYPYCTGSPCAAGGISGYNRHWSTDESASPYSIEVDTSDPFYEPGMQYVIAVFARTVSEFSVTATFSDSIARLTNQVPTAGSAPAGGYTWFFLDIVNPSVALSVILTPLSGSPDLFVSVNSTVRRPTNVSFTKAAYYDGSSSGGGNAGGEALVFTWAELPECPDSSVDHTVFCQAYIGVYADGGLPASFTLLADAVKPNASETMLVDGVPQAGVLVQGDYAWYYALVDVTPTTTYTVTLNPYGTAKVDLYATTDGTRPSATNYNFASYKTNGPEQIVVAPGQPGYNASCVLRVAVHHPFIDYAGYDVTYESSDLTTLQVGVPTWGNVQTAQARYYAVPLLAPQSPSQDEVTIGFTRLSGLRPQLYVGFTSPGNASYYTPNENNTCARGGGGYAQVVSIARGDPCFCADPCVYVVAVACPGVPYGEPTCAYELTATTSSTAPVALQDGVTLANAVAPGAYRYFTFDLSVLVPAGQNLTVGAYSTSAGAGGGLQLVATNARGVLPTLANAVWNSASSGPLGSAAELAVSATDAAIVGCPGCTTLTVGVYGLPPSSAVADDASADDADATRQITAFTITPYTTTGTPIRLSLGQPSVPYTKGYKTEQSFVVFLAETGADLVIDVNVLSGIAAVNVDPFSPRSRCYVGPPPQRAIRCDGLWSDASGSPGPIRISASAPCASSNSSSCNATTAWRPGPYYVSVLIVYSPTTYIVTASTPDGVTTLVDGQPAVVSTNAAAPSQLLFAAAHDPTQPAVHFALAAQALPLSWYLTSCVAGSCPTGADAPGPANPLTLASGSVPARSAAAFTLSPAGQGGLSQGYCNDASGGGQPCLYYIALYPPPACTPAVCSAVGTVTASVAGPGGLPVEVPWSAVAGAVTAVTGTFPLPPPLGAGSGAAVARTGTLNAATAPSSRIELFLSPASSGPVDVAVTVDYCGGAYRPAVFVCDPTAAAPLNCGNPFLPAPGPGGSTASNTTAGAGIGRATLALTQTAASALYMSIVGSFGSRNNGVSGTDGALSAPPSYSVMLSAQNAPYLLAAPLGRRGVDAPGAPVSVTSADATGLGLAWPAAKLGGFDGAYAVPAEGVVYTVYVAAGGFGATNSAGNAATACGLAYWAAGVSPSDAVMLTLPDADVTAVVLSGPLPPSATGYYEAAVVATCNATCLTASGVVAPPGGVLASQSAAYTLTGFTIDGGGGGGGGGGDTKTAAALAGLIFGCLLGVGLLGFIGYRYYRSRRSVYDLLSGGQGFLPVPAMRVAIVDDDGYDGGEQQLGGGGGGGGGAYYEAPSLPEEAPPAARGGAPSGLPPLAALRSGAAAGGPGGGGGGSSGRSSPSLAGQAPAQQQQLWTRSPALRSRVDQLRASVSTPVASGAYTPPATPPLMSLDASSAGAAAGGGSRPSPLVAGIAAAPGSVPLSPALLPAPAGQPPPPWQQ